MKLRNFNLEDEDSLYEPQKGLKVKKMRNPQTKNKSENTGKIPRERR